MNSIRLSIFVFICAALSGCTTTQNEAPKQLQTQTPEPAAPAPAGPALRVSADGSNAAEPAIAAVADGRIFVAWVEHRADKGADVFVREFDSSGSAKADSVRVNPEAGTAKAWRGDPPTIRVGGNGTIFVGWNAATEGSAGASNLQLSVSSDGGRSFAPPVKVNDDSAPASHGMHALAVGDDGRVYMAWLDERYLAGRERSGHHNEMEGGEPNAELYFAVSSDGGETFSPNRRIVGDVCPCCKASITAPEKDGNMYIGWRQVLPGEFRHISIVASSDKGETFGQPVMVSDDRWKLSACPVSGPSLIQDGDALAVTWYSGGEAGPHGLYWTHTHDAGKTFSEPMLISEGNGGGSPVLLGDLVAWADSDKLFTAYISDHQTENKTDLGDGSVPAGAAISNKLFLAFARRHGSDSSVWLSILGR